MRWFSLIIVIPLLTSSVSAESGLRHLSLRCAPQSVQQDGPISTEVSYSASAGWSVAHTLADGRVFKREQQYVVRDDRRHDAWEGRHRKNPKLLMTGEVVNNNGQYKYIERLYDDTKGGRQVAEIIEDCNMPPTGIDEAGAKSNPPKPVQNLQIETAEPNSPAQDSSPTSRNASPSPSVEEQKNDAEKSQGSTSTSGFEAPQMPRSSVESSPAPIAPAQPRVSDQGGKSSTDYTAPLGFLFLASLVGLILLVRMREQKLRTERVLKAVYAAMDQHKRALVRKRFQTLRHDDYGNIIAEQWVKELGYFTEKVLDPAVRQIGTKEYALYETMRPALLLTIASQIEEQAGSPDGFTLGPNLTPTDYEHYCAQQLRAAGWSANTTKTSGDQGTDIVAQKGDLRLVVQCKLDGSKNLARFAIF